MITSTEKNYTITWKGEPKKVPVCTSYRAAKISILTFRYGAIFLLILTAHKLRLVVEHTVNKLGSDNGASSGSYVILTVFIC